MEALTNAPSNNFPPTWRQSLEELGLSNILGLWLLGRLDEIFARNQITPAVASGELQALAQEVEQTHASLAGLTSSLAALHVGQETLAVGDCELGILIPRGFVKNHLDPLGQELRELDSILRPFEEVATGSRQGFAVRAIASTDFGIFLDSLPITAACVATAIERIVALYKSFLEIRKLRNELAKQNVPEVTTNPLNDYVEKMVASNIPKIADELVAEFYIKDDPGRANELKIEIRHSLKAIAARIDRGFYFEVTCNPPDEKAPEGGAQEISIEDERKTAAYERIKAVNEGVKFIKLDGDPLLMLESDDGAKEPNEPEEKEKKPK
jgi:hypothetical protein